MKLFKYMLFAGCAVLSGAASAQGYYSDALIFSRSSHNYGNTARIQAIGGAQTSLGGDMSSAASNPAGLGFFNRSVFSITPSLNIHASTSYFSDNQLSTFKNNFNIPNIGIALNSENEGYSSGKFRGGTFAITYSRINDFNNEYYYEGDPGLNNSNYGSMIDYFIDQAGDLDPSVLPEQEWAAYSTYLINLDDNAPGYTSNVRGFPLISETVTTSGGQNQLNLSWGGNYDDKVYFGVGLGVASLRYRISRFYEEYEYLDQTNGNDQIDNQLTDANFDDLLNIRGGGVNATIGIIVRPLPIFTVGASYKTSTYYALEEESSFTHQVNWLDQLDDDGNQLGLTEYASDIFVNQYSLRTPGRLNVGATFFLGKIGFISGDVQYVDYSSSLIRSSDFNTSGDNQIIQEDYKEAINISLGSEFRMGNFRFRGGIAHYGDPFDDGDYYDESKRNLSLGVGYRTSDFFIDFTLVNSRYNYLLPSYFTEVGGYVDTQTISNSALATIGFNF